MQNKHFKLSIKLLGLLFFAFIVKSYSKEELTLTAQNVQDHIKYLASDELEGRFPGTKGIEEAKNYILNTFKKYGLKPINGAYTQKLDVTVGYELGKNNDVYFNLIIPKPGVPIDKVRPVRKPWETSKDWLPVSLSENGEIEAPMVFVGYGITSKDLHYDDYEGIDVKKKIVVVLTNHPDEGKENSDFIPYSSYRYKATNARDHGAIGIIFVKVQGDSANVFEPLDKDRGERNTGIIAIQVNRNKIAEYFPKNSLYPTELEINKTKKPHSFDLPNAQIHIKVDLEDKKVTTENVFGVLEGSDPTLKNEYVIVGAHYDHLGWGGPTSLYRGKKPMIHNGADDNASGVAVMMELSRLLSQNPPKRSVLFVSFTAEELGLLGSNYFVNHPPIDLKQVSAMVNLDMVGRLRNNELIAIGVGSSNVFSTMINEADSTGEILNISKSDNPIAASDNTSFYLKNIPSIFFFTGVHNDYHRPTDDWDKINYPGCEKIDDFLVKFVNKIANFPEKLPFVKVVGADKDAKMSSGGGYGSKVWFGIIPNFENEPKGFKISGTSPGSPAEKAGLKENDIIIKIDDKEIKNIHDFMYALQEHKAGDVLVVKFLRGNEPKTTDVKLSVKP
jgi:hypothetical protein